VLVKSKHNIVQTYWFLCKPDADEPELERLLVLDSDFQLLLGYPGSHGQPGRAEVNCITEERVNKQASILAATECPDN
jgi:hypothetical protein